MIYEIINPSDAVTMKSDDPAAACVACWFLGEGAYGLTDEAGKNACPIIAFNRGDPNETLKSMYGITLDDLMADPARKLNVGMALSSIMYGSVAERRTIEAAIARMTPEDAKAFLAEDADKRRTSMNNIGKRAAALAEHFAPKGEN